MQRRPEELLLRGLDRLAAQWQTHTRELIAQGAGIGRADIRLAARLLLGNAQEPPGCIAPLWQRWLACNSHLSPEAIAAVEQVLASALAATAEQSPPIAATSEQPHKPKLRNSQTSRQCGSTEKSTRTSSPLHRSTPAIRVVAETTSPTPA